MEYFHGISLNPKGRCSGYLCIDTSMHQASEGWFSHRLSPVPLGEKLPLQLRAALPVVEIKIPSWSLGNKFLCIRFFCAHHIHSFFRAHCIHFFCFIHSFLLSALYSFHLCARHSLLCTLHSFLRCTPHLFLLCTFISSVHTTFIHFFCAHLWERQPFSEACVISSVRSVYFLDGSQDRHP